ncbi:MAG: serine--tRNA ligase, partial [Enterococcus viikkiensis]
MLDVKMIRNNFAEVSEKLATRGVKEEVLKRFLDLDEQRRQLLVKTEELKKYRNDVSG